jgi:transcriptional regulator with XRE-family HTH domain
MVPMNELPPSVLSRRFSKVWFRYAGVLIRVEVRSERSKKFRRQVLLLLFRAMKKSLRDLEALELTHGDSSIWAVCRDMDRRVSLHQALDLDTNAETQGFEIRLKRLHFGLTQEDFAKLSGISRVQISRLERGRMEMTPRTRIAVYEAFRELATMNKKLQMLSKGSGVVAPGGERASVRRRVKTRPTADFTREVRLPRSHKTFRNPSPLRDR